MPWASARSSAMASCRLPRTSSIIASASVGSSATDVLGEAQLDRQRDEVLLGAVVEVALELAPLRVAGGHDAGARGAQLVVGLSQLVERGLQGGVELHVVQGETDLAGELGQHRSSLRRTAHGRRAGRTR